MHFIVLSTSYSGGVHEMVPFHYTVSDSLHGKVLFPFYSTGVHHIVPGHGSRTYSYHEMLLLRHHRMYSDYFI